MSVSPTKDLSQRGLNLGLETSLFKDSEAQRSISFSLRKGSPELKTKAKKKIILSFFFADMTRSKKAKKDKTPITFFSHSLFHV